VNEAPLPPNLDGSDTEMLDRIQKETFEYYVGEVNAGNGLVADSTQPGSPSSIAVVGLALTAYPVGVERGFWTREEAAVRTATTLSFFERSSQGPEADATGYRGFYYHFLDMNTGQRAWHCELSTIDTTFLIAGALAAAAYFDAETERERGIRRMAEALYRRVDWVWACNGGATVTHGWTPESGFLRYRWHGYSEALLLYVLGLASPTHPLPPASYRAWTSTYGWKDIYGTEFLYAGPLFIHQLSHLWLDLRGIADGFVHERGIDYFENSRRATHVQQEYAIRNPQEFAHYGRHCWGITASDGPGPATVKIRGILRKFHGYLARGAPFGPDDGTVAPWAVVASLPFAPEIVLPTIRYFIEEIHLKEREAYGFEATFNATYPETSKNPFGWVSPWILGLNQGPIVMMIENFRSALVWRLMRACPAIRTGLTRAGFRGGWL
jgi:hypothetical protein